MNRRGFLGRAAAVIVAAVVAPLSLLKAKDAYTGAPLTWDDYLEFMNRKRPKPGHKVVQITAPTRQWVRGEYIMGVDLAKDNDFMSVTQCRRDTGEIVFQWAGETKDMPDITGGEHFRLASQPGYPDIPKPISQMSSHSCLDEFYAKEHPNPWTRADWYHSRRKDGADSA